jgi:membrane-associated phospholipid phosphatase
MKKLIKIVSVIFLILNYTLSLNAQNDTLLLKYSSVKLNKDYFKSYFTDSKDIVTAPFHWNTKQWLTATACIGASVLIYTQDEQIREFFQSNRSNFTDNASKYFFDPLGSGLYSLPFLGVLYIYGNTKNAERAKAAALNGVKAYIISGVFAQIIKQISHRHRPYQDILPDPKNWDGPFSDIKYTSFPSAHTMTAFSIATVLASTYKDKKWVAILSYSLAGLAGLSRLNDDEHWASDVFVGAVLGIAIGKTIYNNSVEKTKIKIMPTAFNNGYGVSLIVSL